MRSQVPSKRITVRVPLDLLKDLEEFALRLQEKIPMASVSDAVRTILAEKMKEEQTR